MPTFKYSATNRNGQKDTGKMVARTESEALQRLRAMGLTRVKIALEESQSSWLSQWKPITIDKKGNIQLQIAPPSVSMKEITVFTRQLSALVNASVSIVQCLHMLSEQTTNALFKSILLDVSKRIQNGEDFADALSKHPIAFDRLYVALIRVGTEAGALDGMLENLALYLERSSKLRRQFVGAMSYPIGVTVLAIILVIFELLFVVPMFEKFFAESGSELPAFTQLIVDASRLMTENIHIFLGVSLLLAVVIQKWSKSHSGRLEIQSRMLKMPLFGPLILKIALARFATTMATLTAGGVAILEGLRICSQASGNARIEIEINKIQDAVRLGTTIADAMDKSNIFPKMMSGMVRVGESSGQLDSMLKKIATFYEEEVDSTMAQVLKLMEPILFVVIGGLVGVVLIAMYLPIFDLASTQLGG